MDLEVIRNILVQAKTVGVEQTTAQLKGLSAGYEGVTVASQKTETATESAARKFQRLEGYLDPAARAARQLAKDISTLDAALAQGGTSAERHAQLLSAATANALKMSEGVTQSSAAQKVWAEATAAANSQAQMFASRAGGIGTALSSLSGWWLAAAAGVGLMVTGLKTMAEQSHAVGEKAIELKKFVDTTGLSAAAVQALRQEGIKLGIGSDEIQTKLQKLSVAFEDLRFASTEQLKVLARYRPEAAEALQGTEDFAEQIAILSKAFDGLSVSAQNAIGKAFIGRGAADMVRLLKGTDLNEAAAAFSASGRGLGTEQIEILSKLEQENKHLRHIASEGWAKVFAPEVLEFENLFIQGLLGIGYLYKQNKEAVAAFNKEHKEAAAAKQEADDESRLALLVEREKELNEQLVNRRRNTEFLSVTTERLRANEEEIQQIRARQEARKAEPAQAETKTKEQVYTVGPTIQATIDKQKEYAAALGALLPVQDAVDLKENQLAVTRSTLTKITNEQAAALLAQTELQAELAHVDTGTYERQLEYLKEIKAQYPGMTAQQALAAQALDQQLVAARALTGAEKLSAQYAVDYATAKARGATEGEASAEAAKKQAIAQAQINAGAKEQLFSLQNQYAAASAVTGAEKMRAQATATTNALLRQGVDAYLAQAVGAQELKNAQAAATASVEQSITGLNQQLEVLRASTQEEKDMVLARQAYDNAVASGADAEAARRLQAATQAVSEEKRRQVEENAKLLAQDQERLRLSKEMAKAEFDYAKAINEIFDGTNRLINTMDNAQFAIPSGGRRDTGIPWGPGMVGWGGGVGAASPAAGGSLQTEDQIKQEHEAGLQKQIDEFEMSRIKAQIAGDKGGEIGAVQGELQFYQRQPQTLANLQQIKSLTDQLKQLTDATKDATQSQNALSGLYSRQFGQGFYDGGAAVGDLIYGLDNNTSGAIEDMQKAANDNTRNQNDLLKDLSQRQISSFSYMGGGIVSATENVQSELRSGFANVVLAVKTPAGTTPSSPSGTSPTSPSGTSSPPFYPHIPGTPGFARGGSFTTAGYGGDDTNVVAFRVSPQRERVTITPVAGGGGRDGGNVNHFYNDISITMPQNTDEFRSSAQQVADEIFNQVAIAGRRK